MAVTKQAYTANNIWTAAQLASVFRSAFIDAGLMTEWYDSFVNNSIENRILEVVYDASKTYGKTYYWFMFTTSGVFYHYATGWNTTTKQPTGTLYLDYTNNSFTDTSRMVTLRSGLSTSSPVQILRYTSQDKPSHSWFMVGQSNSFSPFLIAPASHSPASWIDLDKTFFNHLLFPSLSLQNVYAANLTMVSRGFTRRSALLGSAFNGTTTGQEFWTTTAPVASYTAFGRGSNLASNNMGGGGGTGFETSATTIRASMSIALPYANSAANPAYTSNYNPVCLGMPYSMWIPSSAMPTDFGIVGHYANNTMVQLDTFVVTSGVEEWEILAVANNTTVTVGASIALVARVI